MRVHGVTGSIDVSTITIQQLEVGDLLMGTTTLPIVPDVFGGADGVLGNEALGDKRIYIDFRRDRIQIMRSRSERPGTGMSKIPLKLTRGKLLAFKTRIGSVATTAVIDTGAQRTIGNQALRTALNRSKRHAVQEEIIGVTLDVERGDNIRTPPIAFGKATHHRRARDLHGHLDLRALGAHERAGRAAGHGRARHAGRSGDRLQDAGAARALPRPAGPERGQNCGTAE